MKVVICYDIPDHKRRLRVSKILDDYGSRVQGSVFEAILEQGPLKEMCRRVEKLLDMKEDDFRVYFLCGTCEGKTIHMGLAKPYIVEDFKII